MCDLQGISGYLLVLQKVAMWTNCHKDEDDLVYEALLTPNANAEIAIRCAKGSIQLFDCTCDILSGGESLSCLACTALRHGGVIVDISEVIEPFDKFDGRYCNEGTYG